MTGILRGDSNVRRSRTVRWTVLALSAVALVGCGAPAATSPALPPRVADSPTVAAPAGPDAHPQRRPSNVPMTRMAAGDRPPQFVLFSFDGVGVSPNWDEFLRASAETNARFTALMTGLYFLSTENKRHYRGPRHRPGEAALAFGGTKKEVAEQIRYLNRTWQGGHELGTHFVGHFCAGTSHPGKDWSTADWNHELGQFFALMANWRRTNRITAGPDLAFGPEVVKGARTPCLEGSPAKLFPALRRHGMTWDSSMPAARPGLSWPTKTRGVWEFPIPYVWSPPLRARQTALDYNFWFSVNGAKARPRDARRIREVVLGTYRHMFRRAYEGNRAPLVIANHLNDWNGNAFNPPTVRFLRETCGRPDVVCATHQDVIAWMEIQDPAILRTWTSRAPVAASARN